MPTTIDVERAVQEAGGEQGIELKLRRFGDDVRLLQSMRQELLRQYAESWVAVYEGSIIAHAKTVEELWKQLSEKGISGNEAAIDFMAKERKAMLL
ncbi:hypothetical protein ES707_15782 [subsurface metagenome]